MLETYIHIHFMSRIGVGTSVCSFNNDGESTFVYVQLIVYILTLWL